MKTRSPVGHVVHAKEALASDADPLYAIAHALVAIAEHLTTEHVEYACTERIKR